MLIYLVIYLLSVRDGKKEGRKQEGNERTEWERMKKGQRKEGK